MRVPDQKLHVDPRPVLIVEGILALHFPELRAQYELSIFLETDEEVCRRRRQVRDITERQRPLELIRWQWENTVLPATKQFCLPSKRYATQTVSGNSDLGEVEQAVYDAVQWKLTAAV